MEVGGAPVTSTHPGTKHHPFVTPGVYYIYTKLYALYISIYIYMCATAFFCTWLKYTISYVGALSRSQANTDDQIEHVVDYPNKSRCSYVLL